MVICLAERTPTPRPYRALGSRVRALRTGRGMSQWDLADAAGISRSYPGIIERGQNRPDAAILRRIAAVLEADYNELAILAGFLPAPVGDESMPVRPGYRSILERLQERFRPDQLTAIERALADLFFEVGRAPHVPAEHQRQAEHGDEAPEVGPDDDRLAR